MQVRKVVIPAAGLGTRFLPATKVVPKELFPLVDRPLIHEVVAEAVASGISDLVLVTAKGKSAIEDYFDIDPALESLLERKGDKDMLRRVREISRMIRVASVRQKEPLGLGHAVLCAREAVGDEPFAVMLGDDIIDAKVPALSQMLKVYEKYSGSVLALQEVPEDKIHLYGVIKGDAVEKNIYRISEMVEKPPRGQAPSNLAIIGRYVLTPKVFEFLEKQERGVGGEIQLTNALERLAREEPVYGYTFEGKRYDAGSKIGFLEATVELGLKNPELGPLFKAYLKDLDLQAF